MNRMNLAVLGPLAFGIAFGFCTGIGGDWGGQSNCLASGFDLTGETVAHVQEEEQEQSSRVFEKNGLKLSVDLPGHLQPGQEYELMLGVEVPEGFHIYGSRDKTYPTKVIFSESDSYQVTRLEVPRGRRHAKTGGGFNHWLEGKQLIAATLRVADEASGPLQFAGTVDFMICDERACKPPAKINFEVNSVVAPVEESPASSETDSDSPFKQPVRLKAAGEWIAVESPGYAAPCLADIDGDGKKDLLVGQFNGGKIKVYPGLGKAEFGKGRWLKVDGEVATVPGVW